VSDERPGDVRDEAERLVAAALGAASVALRGLRDSGIPAAGLADAATRLLNRGDGHLATGSAECCVCPVCRLIATVRDPSPQLAFRLAAGASDLAAGVTGVMRAFSAATARPAAPKPPPPRRQPDGNATWRAATRAGQPAPAAAAVEEAGEGGDGGYDEGGPEPTTAATAPTAAERGDPWHAATTAPVRPRSRTVAKKVAAKRSPEPADLDDSGTPGPTGRDQLS
jgi:hypothetical protein